MKKFRKLKFFVLLYILAFALVFIGFHLLQAQVEIKSKPLDKGKGKPAPTPLIELLPGDIVTTESNALRVWDCNYGPYDPSNPIWATKTPGHFSVAVGNVDNDPYREIVVPEIKGSVKGGKSAPSNFKIFLNFYKKGESGIWHSTKDYAYISEQVRDAQVMIADVIPENDSDSSINEVILRTYHYLAIFKYVESSGKFEMNSITSKSVTTLTESHFEAVTVGNMDGESGDEIIVSAWTGTRDEGEGHVYILDESFIVLEPVAHDLPNTHLHSIRAANLFGDSDLEICSTGGTYCGSLDNKVLWQAYVLVWILENGEWQCESLVIPGWETPVNMFPYLYLDVGKLNGSEKIAVSANSGYHDYYLYLYDYNGIKIIGPGSIDEGLLLPDARISDVEIGDVYSDINNNEIVVAGRAKSLSLKGPLSVFYLGVFDSNLFPLPWERIGEDRKEGIVFDTAIVE